MKPDCRTCLTRYFEAQNEHDVERWSPASHRTRRCRTKAATSSAPTPSVPGKSETSAKYRITAEPIDARVDGDRTIVVVKVSGTFDGSPAKLTYRFGFSDDGRIRALEVR